ncbi:hypothetical protein M422DRAFT_784718 [Sphaerobolus stellatus SS14]|uniref:Uncharacterized protein n=1 Tax=Sphaerobolus stellatus (strain SS14) TaxID=990650 RepID=A0A0C9TEZ2_SPHS4|nr:hypothetical protein M422DRAFT_784718 [Sphaerobolus stellatus SS14]
MPSGMTGRHHPLQMLAPESRRGAMVTPLLAHEATDIIEFAVDLCENIVTGLLLHGSLVNSPYYNGGTLLSQGAAVAFRHPQLNWLPRLLSDAGKGNVDLLPYARTLGAKIGRPYEDNVVTTSCRIDEANYFAWNVVCALGNATGDFVRLSENSWIKRIIFLQEHGCDINTLNCIIGYDGDDQGYECLQLECCIAFNCISFLTKIFVDSDIDDGPSIWESDWDFQMTV